MAILAARFIVWSLVCLCLNVDPVKIYTAMQVNTCCSSAMSHRAWLGYRRAAAELDC